jgi:hypothetical protein
MKTITTAALLVVGLSTPAWAEGALAVGCSRGGLVWGWEVGQPTTEKAAQIALQRCQAQGSDCTTYRAALNGSGAWIALADDIAALPRCGAFGTAYSDSKEKAAQMAMAACERKGGTQCAVGLLKQNSPVQTYYIVPGTGGGGARPTKPGAKPSPPLCTQLPIGQRYGSGCIP